MDAYELQNTNVAELVSPPVPFEITEDAREVIEELKIGEKVPSIFEILCEEYGDVESAVLTSVPDYDGDGAPAELLFEIGSMLPPPEFREKTKGFFRRLRAEYGFELFRLITVIRRGDGSA